MDEEALLVDTLTRELRAVLHIKDRRYRLVKYSRCFVGCEAVDWLVEHKGLSRAGAVETMRMLYRRKAIHHVRITYNGVVDVWLASSGGVHTVACCRSSVSTSSKTRNYFTGFRKTRKPTS